MVQLLDRYRRVSDGKEFAVTRLGDLLGAPLGEGRGRSITLESEDGERVESQDSSARGHGRFEPSDD